MIPIHSVSLTTTPPPKHTNPPLLYPIRTLSSSISIPTYPPIHKCVPPSSLTTFHAMIKAQQAPRVRTTHKSPTSLNFRLHFTDPHFYVFTSLQNAAERNLQTNHRTIPKIPQKTKLPPHTTSINNTPPSYPTNISTVKSPSSL